MNERKGKLIVIDGTDGSGKETQTKLLVDRLRKEKYPVETADFPQYGQHSAKLVEKYLAGDFGKAEEVSPYLASVYYALDRNAKGAELHRWLEQGKIIISNRYVSSNQGHQAGKLKEPAKIDAFLKWLDYVEYEYFAIPRPDKVILLHMPYQIGQELKRKQREKQMEQASGKGMDIHEKDLNHLKEAEQAYLYVAKKEGWEVIECGEGNSPLPIDDIHKKIYDLVKKIL